MKVSWSKDTRNSVIIYAALLAAALVIFFYAPFERMSPSDEPLTTPPSSEQIPVIETYQDLVKLIDIDPAEIDNSDFPITPVAELHTTIPERVDVDIADYSLVVDGQVRNPLNLTYEEILAYPQTSDVVLLICPGFFADNAEWTGVNLSTLLAEAEILPEVSLITFYGLDVSYEVNYSRTLPIDVINNEGLLLAYQVNGEILPPEHGHPLRLVAEGRKGFDWVKWLWHIEIS